MVRFRVLFAAAALGVALAPQAGAAKPEQPGSQARQWLSRLPSACAKRWSGRDWEGVFPGQGWRKGEPPASAFNDGLRAKAGHPDWVSTAPTRLELSLSTSGLYAEHSNITATAERTVTGDWRLRRVIERTGGEPEPPPPPPLPREDGSTPPTPPMPGPYDGTYESLDARLDPATGAKFNALIADPCLEVEPEAAMRLPDSSSIVLSLAKDGRWRSFDRSRDMGLATDAMIDLMLQVKPPPRHRDWGGYIAPYPASPPTPGRAACAETPSELLTDAQAAALAHALMAKAEPLIEGRSIIPALLDFNPATDAPFRMVRVWGGDVDAIVRGADGVWRRNWRKTYARQMYPETVARLIRAEADPCLETAPLAIEGPFDPAAERPKGEAVLFVSAVRQDWSGAHPGWRVFVIGHEGRKGAVAALDRAFDD